MSQVLNILVWKRTGAVFAALPAASVYIYEPGTKTQVLLEDGDGEVVAQPLTVNLVGLVTSDGLAESDTNRVYLTGGGQGADVRVVLASGAVDQTFKKRDLGAGSTLLTLSSIPGSIPTGARTLVQLILHIAQYTGAPALGRGPQLARIALRESIDKANLSTWDVLLTILDVTLQTAVYQYTVPVGMSVHKASILLVAGTLVKAGDVMWRDLQFFMDRGYLPPQQDGAPSTLTSDGFSSLVFVDRKPTAAENGMILRSLCWRRIPVPVEDDETLGVDLDLEAYVVADAIWRVQELAKLPSESRKTESKDMKPKVLAKRSSLDVSAHGF